jgi:hypothetical protein
MNEQLINKVIAQIEEDLGWGDRSAIFALLSFLPDSTLLGFLSEDEEPMPKAEGRDS